MRRLSLLSLAIASTCLTPQVFASDFSLPFVNTAGLGVAYADWATAANDASTTYTNPAGLVNLQKQQLVLNALGIVGTAKFTGSSLTPPFQLPFAVAETGVARSKIHAFMPSFYYAAPLAKNTTFGFGVTAPFGLGTNYGTTSIARYAATKSQVAAIDIGPSLGIKLSELVSIGAGIDAVNLAFTLNNMYGPPLSFPSDTELRNKQSGWGVGWHGGVLVQAAPKTRVGASFNSSVFIQTTGTSTAYPAVGGELRNYSQETSATLPARAQVSLQQDLTQRLTGMATVFYTNWKTFNQITMERTITPFGTLASVTIPFNYSNCFDYALGFSFKATDKVQLRAGGQILNTPSNDINRGIADPIGSAKILTIGAHFQQNEALGYDIGVGHSFFKQMPVNAANVLTVLNGHTNTQTTVVGGQINWSFG